MIGDVRARWFMLGVVYDGWTCAKRRTSGEPKGYTDWTDLCQAVLGKTSISGKTSLGGAKRGSGLRTKKDENLDVRAGHSLQIILHKV